MQSTTSSGRSTSGVALTGLGGLLMVSGSILPFITGSAGGPFDGQTSSGLRFPRGKVDLGVGIALVLIAVMIRALRLTLFSTRILGIVAVVGSAIVLYWTVRDVSDLSKLPEVDAGTGLYVVLAGSVIGLAGGVLSLLVRSQTSFGGPEPEDSSMPAPPTPEPPSEPSSS